MLVWTPDDFFHQLKYTLSTNKLRNRSRDRYPSLICKFNLTYSSIGQSQESTTWIYWVFVHVSYFVNEIETANFIMKFQME